jgi:hypothetical protein
VKVPPPPRPQHPGISIAKAPKKQTVKAAHGIAGFRIVVLNTGDGALHGVTVTDPRSPGCTRALGALAPHHSTSYGCTSGPVTGPFVNTATVSGTTSTGRTVHGTARSVVEYKPARPSKPKFTG